MTKKGQLAIWLLYADRFYISHCSCLSCFIADYRTLYQRPDQPVDWPLGSADRGACRGRAGAGDLEEAGATPGRTLDYALGSLDFIPQLMWSQEGLSGNRCCGQIRALGRAFILTAVRMDQRERDGGARQRELAEMMRVCPKAGTVVGLEKGEELGRGRCHPALTFTFSQGP